MSFDKWWDNQEINDVEFDIDYVKDIAEESWVSSTNCNWTSVKEGGLPKKDCYVVAIYITDVGARRSYARFVAKYGEFSCKLPTSSFPVSHYIIIPELPEGVE